MSQRRWSLPARSPSSALGSTLALNNVDDNDNSNGGGGGGGEVETTRIALRRNTISVADAAAAEREAVARREAALAEEQMNLAIIYAQLNEVFGVDFGLSLIPDAEAETVATTRTDPSADGGEDDDDNPPNDEEAPSRRQSSRRRRSERASAVYALDPDTGLPLPVATPVGREVEVVDREAACDAFCRTLMCLFIFVFLAMIGVAAVVMLIFILLR